MNWKVGDRAIILYSPGGKSIGNITQILSQLRPASNDVTSGEIVVGDMVYEISARASHAASVCVSKPEWLGPIPDDNSRQVTTWEECPFKPKEVCHVDK